MRQLGEGVWVEDGFARHSYTGSINGRAAGPGYELLEGERPDILEFGEDLLYMAAVRAGWLIGGPDEIADVPDVRVRLGVARRASAAAGQR